MNTGADAADQIVRMTLNGVEVAAKITGTGAKELAVLLYAVLKDQKKTKGKTRLTNMLRSEKPLKVFAVKDSELQLFCKEAKKYGVLYCVLKDKDAGDGLTDIMVRAEDASKINRIFERFKLATVDVGEVRSEIERQRQEQARQKKDGEIPVFLDSNMAFGTGEHETTSMCVELMQEYITPDSVCIDVGCGSGKGSDGHQSLQRDVHHAGALADHAAGRRNQDGGHNHQYRWNHSKDTSHSLPPSFPPAAH